MPLPPITVEPIPQGVRFDEAGVEVRYLVVGTEDKALARSALLDGTPSVEVGMPRSGAEVEEIADGYWNGRVTYTPVERRQEPPRDTGESEFAFEIGGGSLHITHSLATIAAYAPPGQTAPDFQGAINVTDDGVEGLEIGNPQGAQFSETHWLDKSVVTSTYQRRLESLVLTTNHSPFKGRGICEVLFIGASGSRRGRGDWQVTFRFRFSRSATGLSVGPIVDIEKKGWHYLWVRYAATEDAAAKRIVQRPIGVYVERVYEESNFGLIGI